MKVLTESISLRDLSWDDQVASISLGDHAKVATTAEFKSLGIQTLIELEITAAQSLAVLIAA